jgi:hypothetical protein
MNLPIYRLDINEFDDETGIDFVSLVESPAVERDFQAFKQQFVEPNSGEMQNEFMSRCIKFVIDEGKDTEQAIAICASMWDASKFAKISYDWDGVGSTAKGKQMILDSITKGDEVYIISARDSKDNINIDIARDHIFATGSNEAKIAKVKELGISKHFDNNPDVVKALASIGEKFRMNFSIQDEEKRIVSGVAMIADMPIYRRDAIRGEYYVVFDKESIFKIAKKWARSNKYQAVNEHHETPINEGVSLFESYIVDRERGVMPPKGYEDVADGSWFVSYLIDNDEVWAKVKSGEFKGFSVEGVFDFVSELSEDLKVIEELKKVLSQWDGR